MRRKLTHNCITKRTLAFVLCLGMLGGIFTACGTKTVQEAPELLEPAGITESYRPVKRRDIGDTTMLEGTVVAMPYPVFAEKSFQIYRLEVQPGDYVKEGDLIATGDTREIDEEIRALNRQLDSMSSQNSIEADIFALEEKKTGWQKKAAEEAGLTEEARALDTQLRVAREDRRYGQKSVDTAKAAVNKELSKLKEEKKALTFYAPHSGYITFLKDISATNSVQQNENIAVISDYDELYIEVQTMTNGYKYANYEDKYIMVDGRKQPVEELSFTTKEMSYADTISQYPRVRFRAEGIGTEIGATIPIYFRKKSCTDVISVENDSIYREGELYYCYVRNAAGEQERRNLEVGAMDSLYTEVISGLEEGDLVFYDNKSVMPVKYREYEVTARDYVEEFYAEAISMLLTEHELYLSDYTGSLTKLAVALNDKVEKGQTLLEIEIPKGKGEMAELKNRLTDLDNNHAAQVKGFDVQEAQLKAAIAEAESKPAPEKPGSRKPDTDGQDTGAADPDGTAAGSVSDTKPSTSIDNKGNTDSVNDTQNPGDTTDRDPDNQGPENLSPDTAENNTAGNNTTGNNTTQDNTTEDNTADGNTAEDSSETGQEPSLEELYAYRDSLYVKEICGIDLEILNLQRKLEATEYSENRSQLTNQIQELSAGSGSDGHVTIDAKGEGTLGQIGLQENTSIYKGQYLFTVNREGEKLLRISMPKARGQVSQTAAQPGQRIQLRTDDKTYTGTCVAVNGNPNKGYLFTRNGKEHMTYSSQYSAGQAEQFFVKMDDDSYYTDGMPSAVAGFQGRFIRNGTTVPSRAVYSEKDTATDKTINYVWKVTEGGLVRQTVTVYESNLPGDEKLILSGVDIGDKVVVE